MAENTREEALTPEQLKTKKVRDGDILISIFLILGCLWTAWESLRMSWERYSQGMARIYTVPGLFPFIVSIAIIVCSSFVLARAVREHGDLKYLMPRELKKSFATFHSFTAIVITGLIWIFVYLAVERMPFSIATFLFLTAFMLIFRAARPAWIVLVSLIYSVAIAYFFTAVVGTRFPVRWFF